MTHEVPVDVPKERMTHDVSEASLRVAAQTLLGILGEGVKVREGWETVSSGGGRDETKCQWAAGEVERVTKQTWQKTRDGSEGGWEDGNGEAFFWQVRRHEGGMEN